ncbi:cytochrome c [Henriciella sp. AS95]|uniref:c-type cytochrome n=1 Tax=Henriciella sp. AS95 TaxID=3135782 RepID=UPI0031780B6B
MKFVGYTALIAGVLGMVSACGGEGGDTASSDAAATADPALVRQVEQRQAGFQDMGAAFKAINDEVRAGRPNSTTVDFSIDSVVRYGRDMHSWFPEGTGPDLGIEMEAKANIWEEPEEFQAHIEQFEDALNDLEAAKGGEASVVQAAFGKTGGACKACHEKFREED